MPTEKTLAQALREKKQKVQHLVRITGYLYNEVSYLQNDRDSGSAAFQGLLTQRVVLVDEIEALKAAIRRTNADAELDELIQLYGRLKEELSFWNKVQEEVNAGGDVYRRRGRKHLRPTDENPICCAVPKEEVAGHIDRLTAALADLDTDIQAKNHSTVLMGG